MGSGPKLRENIFVARKHGRGSFRNCFFSLENLSTPVPMIPSATKQIPVKLQRRLPSIPCPLFPSLQDPPKPVKGQATIILKVKAKTCLTPATPTTTRATTPITNSTSTPTTSFLLSKDPLRLRAILHSLKANMTSMSLSSKLSK